MGMGWGGILAMWWNEKKYCAWCGKLFKPKGPKHKTCCDFCSDKYHAMRVEQKRIKRLELCNAEER